MFKRKVYDRLVEWKRNSNGTSAMLIEGARHVGKSTLATFFAEREYDSHMLIDFTEVTEDFKQAFLECAYKHPVPIDLSRVHRIRRIARFLRVSFVWPPVDIG